MTKYLASSDERSILVNRASKFVGRTAAEPFEYPRLCQHALLHTTNRFPINTIVNIGEQATWECMEESETNTCLLQSQTLPTCMLSIRRDLVKAKYIRPLVVWNGLKAHKLSNSLYSFPKVIKDNPHPLTPWT